MSSLATTFVCDFCNLPFEGIPFGAVGESICCPCWLEINREEERMDKERRQMAEAMGVWDLSVTHACGHSAHYTWGREPTAATRAQFAVFPCLSCRKAKSGETDA